MSKAMTLMNELIELISMGPFGSDIKVDNFISEGVPVLNGSNVASIKLIETSFKYVSPEKAKALKKANAKRGDIVITHRGTVGQISYIPEDSKYDNYVISQSQFRVSLKRDLVDPIYFTYYFHTDEGQKRLLSFKSHVGVPALAQATTNFRLLEFPLIPLDEQQKIAKVLSDLDAKIELNNYINAELEAMAKTLYDYWFVQFDFPDVNGNPYKTSGGKMVWNEELKREIPEGWEVKTLLDIATFVNGLACQKFRPKEDEDSYRVIKIREMGTGFTENTEFVSTNIPEKVVVYNGDILFSWSATLDVKIWTGGTGALNQHIFKITSKKYPKSYYYFELLNYLQHFKMMAELRKTTMGHITQEHLKESRIVIPSMDLINKLDEIITPILDKKVKLEEENQELASLRDWLLPMLMNGQVSVGDVEEELGMVAEGGAEYKKDIH
jgi:type I restriction enzyme S subunit